MLRGEMICVLPLVGRAGAGYRYGFAGHQKEMEMRNAERNHCMQKDCRILKYEIYLRGGETKVILTSFAG